jgi:hypothetical protein
VDRDRISALDAEGWTTQEIGEEMGISAASVCRLLKSHHRPMQPQVFGDLRSQKWRAGAD